MWIAAGFMEWYTSIYTRYFGVAHRPKDIQFYEKPDITDVDFPIRIKSIYSDESTDIFLTSIGIKRLNFSILHQERP